jgi:hypothetical protein
MPAITHVYTLARVADMLGEDEDWLHEISIAMDPEDGTLTVCGLADDATPAFTDFGIENLQQLIQIHDDDPTLMPQRPSPKASSRP